MISSGYVTPDMSIKAYDNSNSDEDIEDNLNYYRFHQFANMLLELALRIKKELLNELDC